MRPGAEDLRRIILASLAEEGVAAEESASDLSKLPLLGPGAVLKSVGLVAMLVGVEQRLTEEFHVQVPLMDEHAMSQSRSPFRTAATLAEYIAQRLR